MKHLLAYLCLAIIILATYPVIHEYYRPVAAYPTHYHNISNLNILIFDNCEYVLYGKGLAHKGNCTNKIHLK